MSLNEKSYWVVSGPGFPCGARELGEELLGPAREGTVWLDVCLMGNHLSQMYRTEEVHELTSARAEELGLCGHCMGFGDMDKSTLFDCLARTADETGTPCPVCAGSGRACLRVTVVRTEASITGQLRILPHRYVAPPEGDWQLELRFVFEAPPDMCLACGNPRDGRGPRDEVLHVD